MFATVVLLAAGSGRAADEPESELFDSNGVKIHYLVQGKGEPVITDPRPAHQREPQLESPRRSADLAKTYQVIAIDLPGHGQSDWPQAEDAYGLKVVEDVVRLLDHLKIKKVHVVGYSLGGMVTVKFLTPTRTGWRRGRGRDGLVPGRVRPRRRSGRGSPRRGCSPRRRSSRASASWR